MRQVFFQKLTAFLLTLTLALGLCACGGQGAGERGSQTAGSVSLKVTGSGGSSCCG